MIDSDLTSKVEEYYQPKLSDNNMQNGILKLDWTNVKSAIVYGLIFGVGAVLIYMAQKGSVFVLDWHSMVDAFVFGFIGSVIKNLFTTSDGNFLGIVKVIPPIS